MENNIQQTEYQQKAKAKKTMLLLAMASFIMMFAGLTSAYVISSNRPDWLKDFQLPNIFIYSTITIVLSSITMHLAKSAIQKGNRSLTSIMLAITLVFGLAFIIMQIKGFEQIIANGYYFTGSESTITTSFFYVIVIMHIFHVIGGLIALLIIIYNHYKQKYKPGQTLGIELGAWFWHFLDLLWLYLFLFFTFYK